MSEHITKTITISDPEKAGHIIDQITQSMAFFKLRLQDRPTLNDINTHMPLFESYFDELSNLIDYKSVQTKRRTVQREEIKQKNIEIHELHQKLAAQITPEGLSARLRLYDDIIRLYYGACGFHYASLREYTSWGIRYEFSEELEEEPYDGHSGKKGWMDYIKHPLIIDSKFDTYRDTYRIELLDTDHNKQMIQEWIHKDFPNAIFQGFSSHPNDYGSYSMRTNITFLYKDIDVYMRKHIPYYKI